MRDPELQAFLDAARAAYEEQADGPAAREIAGHVFARLATPAPMRGGTGARLPVCRHLDAALAVARAFSPARDLIAHFEAIEPRLVWVRRTRDDFNSASANFAEGHANAMIAGPGGLEERDDLWFGVSLLAPHVSYPEHEHDDDDEAYLLLSPGEFWHGTRGDWFAPPMGAVVSHPPQTHHAMRSLAAPFFSFWILTTHAGEG